MDAKIVGEDGSTVGVTVYDNNNIEHRLGMEFNGEKYAHNQDGYPDDPSKRSMIDEVEPINQAARYAQYYVNRERGYDTIEWRQDPDRILAVAGAVATLETGTVTEYFGELYDQVQSHSTDGERPVELPENVIPSHAIYQQDVYLGLDEDALTALSDLGEHLDMSAPPEDQAKSFEGMIAALLDAAPSDATIPDQTNLEIDTVSGVHVRWDDASGQYHHERHDQPAIECDPDARIDVLPFEPESIEYLQTQLVHNLVCQARDCYIEMGVTPPESLQIQGLGKHRTATWYEHYDFYQRYHDPQADIDWDALEPVDHRETREKADT